MSSVQADVDTAGSARAPRAGRAVGVAAGALAVGVLVGVVVSPGPQRLAPAAAVDEPVVSTTFVCPDWRGATRVSSTTIVATTPNGLVDGTTSRGRAVLGLLTKRGPLTPVDTFDRPGQASFIISAREPRGPVVGAGTGRMAPGFSAGQLTTQFSGLGRGLAGIDCADVASEQWFVGGGTASGQTTSLILVNPETSAASVDVELFSAAGRLDAPGGLGVVVRSRSTRVLPLDTLAPGQQVIAVHVKADRGRLAMALKTSDRAGAEGRGTDYVPPGTAPSTRLLIPAIPRGAGSRDLFVLAPGGTDADVRLRVVGREDTFAPVGADRFTASAGTLLAVRLPATIATENVGLLLESDVPIVAGARVRFRADGRGQKAEYAWSSAVPPINGTAIEPMNRVGEGFQSLLMLSAPEKEARVQLRLGPPGKALRSRTIRIAAGTTWTQPLGGRGDRGLLVAVITPLDGSGPVWAGRVQTRTSPDGVLLTVSPQRDARITAAVPESVPDLGAVLDDRRAAD